MAHFRKRTRNGRATYFWRAKVPVRKPDGSFGWRDVERSTGTGNLVEAREKARIFEREYHDQLDRPLSEVAGTFLFAEAAATYLRAGGSQRYLQPLLLKIGTTPVIEIDQDLMHSVAAELYAGATAGTINRQVFTPVLAVLNFAAGQGRCPPPLLKRPRGHDKAPKLELPPEHWFDLVLERLNPKMRALMLLLTLHGLRISEAIERRPDELDAERWILSVPDSKTGEPFEVALSEPVVEAIKEIPDWRRQRWLFGSASRSNVYRAIREACAAAGVPAYGSHAFGRHSFASRLLREGYSLKFLKDAGRWKTIKMPAQRYGHLEQSEVNEEVKGMASRWGERRKAKTVIPISTGHRRGSA